MQDNTPIYTALIVKSQLEEYFITVMKQPLYSPNLNLVENLQVILKREIYKYYPKLLTAPNTE